MLAVIFNGLDAQVQFVRDLPRLFPLADQLKDFQFTVAESFDRRLIDVGLAADLLLEHFGGEAVTDINGPAEHSPDGGQNLFQGLLLHEISQGARPEGNLGVNGFVMDANDEYGQTGILGLNVAHQFQAAAVFERDVGNYQTGFEAADGAHGAGGILFLPADDHIRLPINKLRNPIAHHRVIVHQ